MARFHVYPGYMPERGVWKKLHWLMAVVVWFVMLVLILTFVALVCLCCALGSFIDEKLHDNRRG